MRLNCLSCGHSVDLYRDYDDYDGQVKCFVCGALLTIRTEEGRIKKVMLSPLMPRTGSEAVGAEVLHSVS